MCIYCRLLGQPMPGHNYIALNVHQPLNFTYRSANDLLKDNVLDDALQLNVNSPANATTVSAFIIVNGNGDYSNLYNKFFLRLNNKTSGTTNAVQGEKIALSPVPRILFTQSKTGTDQLNTFNYDLILHPDDNGLKPADFNFSIVFTMSQP